MTSSDFLFYLSLQHEDCVCLWHLLCCLFRIDEKKYLCICLFFRSPELSLNCDSHTRVWTEPWPLWTVTPKCRYDVLLQWINWGCCLSRILSSCFVFADDFFLCDHLMLVSKWLLYKKPTLCNSKSAALESLKYTYRLLIVLLDQIYLNINTAFFMHTWFLVGVGSKCRNLRPTCYTDDEAVNKSVSVTSAFQTFRPQMESKPLGTWLTDGSDLRQNSFLSQCSTLKRWNLSLMLVSDCSIVKSYCSHLETHTQHIIVTYLVLWYCCAICTKKSQIFFYRTQIFIFRLTFCQFLYLTWQ